MARSKRTKPNTVSKSTPASEVVPEVAEVAPRSTVKAITTFIEAEQMYKVIVAGKSNKYGIGSTVPVGSCAFTEKRGAWTAKTLGDAEQMCKDFASNILKLKGK